MNSLNKLQEVALLQETIRNSEIALGKNIYPWISEAITAHANATREQILVNESKHAKQQAKQAIVFSMLGYK